jgi:hypothetical protein
MRTKIALISTTLLLSAGITMHHFRYCPLQHLKSYVSHHKATPPTAKDAKTTVSAAVVALNK